MAIMNKLCSISLHFDFTIFFFLFPNRQSGGDNFFATRSNRMLSFLFVEGYNPRIILRSECLSLQYLAHIAAVKMFLSRLNGYIFFACFPFLAQIYLDNPGIVRWRFCLHIHAVIILGWPLSLLKVTFHWWVIKPEKYSIMARHWIQMSFCVWSAEIWIKTDKCVWFRIKSLKKGTLNNNNNNQPCPIKPNLGSLFKIA